VAKGEKLLERMRANPRADWRIEDVQTVCRAFGLVLRKPGGGSSHATVSHPTQAQILTVVARRPIKPVYIVKLVSFIDSVLEANHEGA
jgi:hypothetical protein